jgi:PAS domain S-box-containing protein
MTQSDHRDALQRELDLARARIAELEEQLAQRESRGTDLEAAQAEGRHMKAWFSDIVSNVPGVFWESWGDQAENRVGFISDYIETMVGYTPAEWMSMRGAWLQLVHPDDKERVRRELAALLDTKGGAIQTRWITKDGRVIWADIRFAVIRDEQGKVIGRRGITLDITAFKEAEEERARLQQALIDAQAAALVEVSTPLIPLSDRAMVMPLVGVLDKLRAEKVLERLLEGMARAGATVAIVDVTGVPELDRAAADMLIRAARGVQLLGAQVVLTGVRPEVARALVELEIDLTGITTRNTLASGIAYAMGLR